MSAAEVEEARADEGAAHAAGHAGAAQPLVCRGAPRDLGADQGRACRGAVRRAVDPAPFSGALGLLRLALTPAAPGAAVHRDLGRFFPHLAERTLGLARAAGLPATALTARLAAELGAPHAAVERAALLLPERTGAGPLLARTLGAARPDELVLRESVPESDFRSLEIVRCFSPGALAGVNEHGLAAAAVALPAAPDMLEACSAPATLLVQECLQRFDTLEPALAWCERRPAGGAASVLLSDAAGRGALVVVEGGRRRVVAPAQGLLVGLAPGDGAERLAKHLRESATTLPAPELLALLRAEIPGAQVTLVVDPRARRVGIARDGAVGWAALRDAGAP